MNITEDEIFGTEIYGSKAGAVFHYGKPLTVVSEEYNRINVSQVVRRNLNISNYHAEIEHFIDCVINGKEPLVKPEEALAVMKIQDAIYRSQETKEAVKIV